MAIWRLGAVHVPLFTAFAPAAVAYRLSASGCKLVLCDDAQRDKLKPGEDIPTSPSWRIVTTERGDVDAQCYQDLLSRSNSRHGLTPPASIRLRCASSAGEPLTPDVNEWAAAALGISVHDHYGQTETGMLINNHHHPALRRPIRPGSMGQSLPGWTPVASGHIRVCGPGLAR